MRDTRIVSIDGQLKFTLTDTIVVPLRVSPGGLLLFTVITLRLSAGSPVVMVIFS